MNKAKVDHFLTKGILKNKYFYLILWWLFLLGGSVILLKTSSTHSSTWFSQKRAQAQQDRGIKLLNMNMPTRDEYKTLMTINSQGQRLSIGKQAMNYFEILTQAMPTVFEGYLALGFCQYYSDSQEQAFLMFQKSWQLDPEYFYTSFNLAVLALEHRQPNMAKSFLTHALKQPPKHTIEKILASKVFQDIEQADPAYNPLLALEDSYKKAAKALYYLEQQSTSSLPSEIQLHVKIL